MAASWMKLASAVGIAGAFCALIPSCAENGQTIFIRQIQAVKAPECTVNNDVTALTAPSGFLDMGIASNYIIHPLVGNQLLSRADPRTSRAEPNRVLIEGAEVELLTPSGAAVNLGGGLANPFSVIATGTVDPTTSADATYGVTSVEVIPPVVLQAYRRANFAGAPLGTTLAIHAKIKVFGRTLGNTTVETGPFTYPITVCYGCGVQVPSDAIDTTVSTRNCLAPASTGTGGTAQKTICSIGQDAFTDCRVCQGVIPLCTPCSSDAECSTMLSPVSGGPARCNTTAFFCE